MRSTSGPFALLLPIVLAAAPMEAHAAWPSGPGSDVTVCAATGAQSGPIMAPDGEGGAIFVWSDPRNGGQDLYAQRLAADGTPLWTTDGVAVCLATGDQIQPRVVPDGAGGVIVVWQDWRSALPAPYAQRLDAGGAAQWPPDGIAVSPIAAYHSTISLAPDGAGGAFVVWDDNRNPGMDVYAQRLNASGAALWAATGLAVCTASGVQQAPLAIADGLGGLLVTWSDGRNDAAGDLYAQRVTAGGAMEFGLDGVVVCGASGTQSYGDMIADGIGGAILSWTDHRSGGPEIYVQRLTSSGLSIWAANGVQIAGGAGGRAGARLASDRDGGAYAVWMDERNGNWDVFAEHVFADGARSWGAGFGMALCAAPGEQRFPRIIPDGAQGFIATWADTRSGGSDLYAQRVDDNWGALWAANGIPFATSSGDQEPVDFVADATGGGIAGWQDARSGTADVYAQRIQHFGKVGRPEPRLDGAADVPGDQGGWARLTWISSYLDYQSTGDVTGYRLWRSAAV